MQEQRDYHGAYWTILDKNDKRWDYLNHPDRGLVLGFASEHEAWEWVHNRPDADSASLYEVLGSMRTIESDVPFGDGLSFHLDFLIRRSKRWIVADNTPIIPDEF